MPLSRVLITVVYLLLWLGPASSMGSPLSRAEDAYYQIEANVFEREQVEKALANIEAARKVSPNDSWVYLSLSLATLVSGYRIGDWYSMNTFEPGTVDAAMVWANKARALDAGNGQVHAHIARLLIIKGDYENAWKMLNRSYEIAPNSFYPWYFKGIIAAKMRDATRSHTYFAEAERRIAHSYQLGLVNGHRRKLARQTGDVAEEERLLKDNIAQKPNDAHYHGNYAMFLQRVGRYDESIRHWERAISISPYPHAVQQLEETRRLKARGDK